MEIKKQNAFVNSMGVKPYIVNPCLTVDVDFLDLVRGAFKRVMRIGKNLIRYFKNGNFHLEQEIRLCPICKSHNVVKNGTNSRKLTFKYLGKIKVRIQKYFCKKMWCSFCSGLVFYRYSL